MTTPRPSGAVRSRSAVSNSGSPKNVAGALRLEVMRSRRITPAVAFESPPSALRSALPSSEVSRLDHGAQVLEVEQREAVLVGEVEDQPEAGSPACR